MSEESHEKKHQPSKRRLETLKKEGHFLRAKEYYASLVLIASCVCLYFMRDIFYQQFTRNFSLIYHNLPTLIANPSEQAKIFEGILWGNVYTLMPLFLVQWLIFFLAVSSLGGLQFAKKNMTFKPERLSMIKNLGRIFSMQNLMELIKSIVKIVLFLGLLFLFLSMYQYNILDLAHVRNKEVIHNSLSLFSYFLLYMILGIAILALVDALMNYHQFRKKAMMSDQEVKDEQKETDGNPEIKRKLRQKQMAIAMQKLQQEMPEATLIITNPTHFAIALRYQEGKDKAPKIIGKGADHMAMHIRNLARQYNIPVYESPVLARAIYFSGEVGQLIHPELYMAVALVLSYIFQMEAYQAGRAEMPLAPQDLQIPEALVVPSQEGV